MYLWVFAKKKTPVLQAMLWVLHLDFWIHHLSVSLLDKNLMCQMYLLVSCSFPVKIWGLLQSHLCWKIQFQNSCYVLLTINPTMVTKLQFWSTYFGNLSITWMLDKNHPLASGCKIQARTCSLVSKCSRHFCYLFQLQIRRKWEIIKCEWWEAFDTILTFLTRHLYPYHKWSKPKTRG